MDVAMIDPRLMKTRVDNKTMLVILTVTTFHQHHCSLSYILTVNDNLR